MASVGAAVMSNGVKLPLLGYGTWLAKDLDQLKAAIRVALDAGYRYFDTAYIYGNESAVGDVIKEYVDAGKIQRSDVFITTKLPMFGHKPEHAEEIIARSLKNLKTDYVDLYLLHTPLPFVPKDDLSGPKVGEDGKFIPADIPLMDTWRVIEKHYKAGTFKAVGISNFNSKQIQALYDQAEVKPQNLQVELHILFPQTKLVEFSRNLGLTVTSYSSLGSPGRAAGLSKTFVEADCMNHPVTLDLAKKYNKTPAQILLRHLLQKGISVIPKSVTPERIKQNIQVFDFEISPEDVKRFDDITERAKLLVFDFAYHHPNFPFREPF